MDLAQKLQTVINGEVETGQETLEKYSQDASIFQIKPQIVVYPKNSADVEHLVQFAAKEKKKNPNFSLTPRSAGTDMSGGPLTSSVVVEMAKHFNKLLKVDDDFAITQPGVFYRDFEKETLKYDLLLPPYPASRELCTVGGMVANNSGGEKTLVYGKTENFIEELKMVLSDGKEHTFSPIPVSEISQKIKQGGLEGTIYKEIYKLVSENRELLEKAKPKVSKNSAGYYLWNVLNHEKGIFDLTKLLVGSQGTLGIVTQIKFRLIHPKKNSVLLVIFLKDLKVLGQLAEKVLTYGPESFESYDDNTFKIALKFFPEIARELKGNLLKLFWQFLPEFLMVLTGGVPKLVLLAEFTADTHEQALKKAVDAKKGIHDFKLKTSITHSQGEENKYFVIRRESFNLLRHHIRGMHTAPFIDDVTVRPEFLSEFLPKLYQILGKYKMIYTLAGHVGDGNFHIIPLMRFDDPKTKEIIKELSPKVYKLVVSYHGSITAEHNDGLIRSPYLHLMYGEKIYKLFEKVKNIFDPEGIFNPGKKVHASSEYAFDHIKLQ